MQYLADESFDGLDKVDQVYNTLRLDAHWLKWKRLLSKPIGWNDEAIFDSDFRELVGPELDVRRTAT